MHSLSGCFFHIGQQAQHGFFYCRIACEAVANVHEGQINATALRQVEILMVQTICLSYAATHGHAVYGMAQAAFRHRNQKGYRGIGVPCRILTPHGAQGISQRAVRRSVCTIAEELFYGYSTAEFFFFL